MDRCVVASNDSVPLAPELAKWSQELAVAGVPSPGNDTRVLVAHVLNIGLGQLVLHGSLTTRELHEVDVLVERRKTREPLQHITREVGFLGLDLVVGPGVFVPRPETELLADHVVRRLADEPRSAGLQIVDLCAGTGALGLAVAANVPGVSCVGVELSREAAGYAEQNCGQCAQQLALIGSSYELVVADATDCAGSHLSGLVGQTDVVLCNPPYVPDEAIPREPEVRNYDPALALYGGPDGLEVVRGLLNTAAKLLRPGGLLFVEHADSQGENPEVAGLPELLRSYSMPADANRSMAAFERVLDHEDLNSLPRFTSAVRSG